MAENPALTLLQNEQRASSDAFARISGAAEGILQTEQQTNGFMVDLATKQFQIGEEKRKTDATLANIAFSNQLNAKQFELQSELAPWQVAAKMMEIESTKQSLMLRSQQASDAHFAAISAPYDAIIASRFAQVQDPNLANTYLDLKSRTQSWMMRGGKFDGDVFGSQVNALLSNYKDTTPSSEYSPETATLMDKLGDTAEAARYRARNPEFAGSITGLKTAAVLGGTRGYTDIISKYGNLFSDEDASQLGITAQSYESLSNELQNMNKEAAALSRAYAIEDDPQQKALIQKQLNDTSNRIDMVNQKRSDIFTSMLKGQTSSASVQDPISQVDRQLSEALKESQQIKSARESGKVDPNASDQTKAFAQTVPRSAAPLEENSSQLNTVSDQYSQLQSSFPKALNGITLIPFRGSDLRQNQEGISSIRNQIIQNLSTFKDSELENAFEGSSLESLLRPLSDSPIGFETQSRVSGSFFDRLDGSQEVVVGKPSKLQRAALFVRGDGNDQHLYTVDDIRKAKNKIKGTPNERRIATEDLYANLLTARIIDSYRVR